MAENDIIVPKENASGGFDEVALTPADIGAATTESTVAKAKALADEFTGNPALIYTSEGSNGWTTLTDPASFRDALELGTAATADSTDFAPAVTEIEVPNNGTSTTTLTTGQLPARVIIFVDADAAPSATINLPTPGVRESGLLASIKVQVEGGTASSALVTVVHDATTLLNGYELDEAESSIDFLWDGYAWTYSSTSRLRSYPNRVLQLPDASGTIARTEDFAAPPAIGNTTPAAITGTTGTFSTLNATNGTITSSAPVLDLSQTWNNAAVAFTGLRFNVTDTASGSSSVLADFQVGGTSRMFIRTDGAIRWNVSGPIIRPFSTTVLEFGSGGVSNSVLMSDGWAMNSTTYFGFSDSANAGSTRDVRLFRDAAAVLALRNLANPQTFRIYNTTDAGLTNYERGFMRWSSNVLQIGTEAAGTGTVRNIALRTGSTDRLVIDNNGNVGINVSAPERPFHISGSSMWARFDRVGSFGPAIMMVRQATLGSTNSSWLLGSPNTAGVSNEDFALIDYGTSISGTIGTPRLTVAKSDGQVTISGNLNISTKDLVTDTTTGTKIGTATSQKIGFFNATPVVQQAAIADATDAATTQARLNDLLATMRTFGLIAT